MPADQLAKFRLRCWVLAVPCPCHDSDNGFEWALIFLRFDIWKSFCLMSQCTFLHREHTLTACVFFNPKYVCSCLKTVLQVPLSIRPSSPVAHAGLYLDCVCKGLHLKRIASPGTVFKFVVGLPLILSFLCPHFFPFLRLVRLVHFICSFFYLSIFIETLCHRRRLAASTLC